RRLRLRAVALSSARQRRRELPVKEEVVICAPMYPGTLRQLDETFTTYRLWEAPDKPGLLASVKDRVRAIATPGTYGAKAELMDALPKLEIISCFAVGVDA